MSSYSDKLKSPKWQKKRLKILERDNFTCRSCKGTESQLHVHHIKYGDGNPWEVPDIYLITLCDDCHKLEHTWRESWEQSLLEILREHGFCYNDIFLLYQNIGADFITPFTLKSYKECNEKVNV